MHNNLDAKTNNSKSSIDWIEAAIELAVFVTAFYFIGRFFYHNYMNLHNAWEVWVLLGIYLILLIVLIRLNDGFEFGYLKLTTVFASQLISTFLVNLITYFQLCLMSNKMLNILPILVLWFAEIAIGFICIYIFTFIYHRVNVPQNMLMIYGNEDVITLKFKMDSRKDNYAVTEIVNINEGHDAVSEKIKNHDSVILNDIPAELRNDILKDCYKQRIRTYILPKVSDIIIRGATAINLFDTPLLLVRGGGISRSESIIKRFFDILLSLIAMVPFVLIWLIVTIAIKIEDGGPVFYRQTRVTKDCRTFEIYKFRSMVVNAENGGYEMSMRATGDDPRITKVGKFLRKCRLDELPQLLNILKGEMSIVGPRPERVENEEEYTELLPEFIFRHRVKAGLTGYAQVFGKYNTNPYDKLKLDLMYIENFSIFLDAKLIMLTIKVLFTPEAVEGFEKAEELEKKKNELIEKELYSK